jgi:uncharacterized CHY-type Zn-finger protein
MDVEIKGKIIDSETRCVHYHSSQDIIAIKFKCCHEYYACYECHKETTEHEPTTWTKGERNITAIKCGVCKLEMTIETYLQSGNHCPACHAAFNPKCANHYHLYFDI